MTRPSSLHHAAQLPGLTLPRSTRSANPSIFNYIRENGRTYHSYHPGCKCSNTLEPSHTPRLTVQQHTRSPTTRCAPTDSPQPRREDPALTVGLQPENDRMHVQHVIWKIVFRGRNHFAPLDDPHSIIDIGCGTGQWVIEMGLLHLLLHQRHVNRNRHRLPQRTCA